MRILTGGLFLCCVGVLAADCARGQPLTGALEKPPLDGRIELDQHEHCFTVRLFIKNVTDKDIDVTYGSGDKGLEVVPFFNYGKTTDIFISPPTYLRRPKRSLSPNVMPIPAGKEVLYGTFTMGYPYSEQAIVDELFTTINFKQPQTIVEAKPVRLTIPAQKSGPAAVSIAPNHDPQTPESPGEWVNSDDGKLSLRLRVKAASVAPQDSVVLVAAIRNNRAGPVTILRPFGDSYFAEGVQIKIWNAQGQIKYTGPVADYDLNAAAFVTLGPNELATDTLELPVRHFAGTDKAGSYTVRFDYSYLGTWDKKVASEGVQGIWHGAVCSREVQFKKQEAAVKAPAEKPDQQQLNADLRRLLSLETILVEKPDDETAEQEAASLARQLAPHLSGNRLVWQMLVKTRTLKDGLSLADAEKLLGAPTEKSDKSVGWYHNPHGAHIAPYLKARITQDGLAEWKLSNR